MRIAPRRRGVALALLFGGAFGPAFGGAAACSSHHDAASTPAGPGSLVLVREKKLSEIFAGADHYEASGVVLANGALKIVFDDLQTIGTVSVDLGSGSMGAGSSADSQFEAITAGNGSLFVAKEATLGAIEVFDENGVFLREEATDLVFPAANSALEGLAYLDPTHLLAMGEKDGGKAFVLEKSGPGWKTLATLLVPVTFGDYADVGLRDTGDGGFAMAVVSQESAKVWLGRLATQPYRIDGAGSVYALDAKYCELEGITFLDATTLALVSDKSDKDRCKAEGESVHIFSIQ